VTRKTKAQVEIDVAISNLEWHRDYGKEITASEGHREARAHLTSRDCVFRCKRATDTLKRHGQPLPDWLDNELPYYKAMGWV
jgi:hypothetical protein